MANPSIQLGNGNWAVKSDSLLGYALIQNKYVSRDFTVTRATTGTRVNSAGLVEVVPYNLFTYSEQFNNAAWGKLGGSSVTANQAIAPNGTMTADLITEGTSVLVYNTTLYPAGTYTQSYYAKKGTGDIFGMYFGGSYGARFNLTTGTIVSATNATASITNVGDGWYRCIATATPVSDFFGGINYSNTTGANIFAWGAQLAQGTSALDYLPTTTRLNIPRIDYSTGSPALLIEPQRTNLFIFSEQYDNANWIKADATINVNSTTSPSGIVNADTFIESNTNATHSVSISTTGVLNTFYSITTYVKASGRNFIQFTTGGGFTNLYANINLMDGNINYGTIGVGNVQVTSVGSQWYKISITRQLTASTSISFKLNLIQGINSVIDEAYLGNGISGVAIWGSQCEAGSYPTSYIPTTSATVTRNTDQISRGNIFTNGYITSTGGTWFVELRNNLSYVRDAGAFSLFLGDSFPSPNNGLILRSAVSASTRLSINKRILSAETTLYTTLTDSVKIAIKWNGTTAEVFVNGVKVVTATAFTTTALEFLIGQAQDVPKYINKMDLYTTPLSDTECQQLTTL
jgi:hypothetical protein